MEGVGFHNGAKNLTTINEVIMLTIVLLEIVFGLIFINFTIK